MSLSIASSHWLCQPFFHGLWIRHAIMFVRQVIQAVFATTLLWGCVAPLQAQMRLWTDTTGKFSVEAELMETRQGSVVLKKASGSTVTVPLARLSNADREYLKTVAKPVANPPKGNGLTALLAFPDAMTESPPWNDANSPFDLAEFLRAPPAEENAAPLYLDASLNSASNEMDFYVPRSAKAEMMERGVSTIGTFRGAERLEDAWEKDLNRSTTPPSTPGWQLRRGVRKACGGAAAAQVRISDGTESLLAAAPHPGCPSGRQGRQVANEARYSARRLGAAPPGSQDAAAAKPRPAGEGNIAQLASIVIERSLLRAGAHDPECSRHRSPTLRSAAGPPGRARGEGDRRVCGRQSCRIHRSRQALHDLQHRTGSFDPKFMRDEWGLSGDVTSPLACIKIITDLGDTVRSNWRR